MKWRKIAAMGLALSMGMTMMAGCGDKSSGTDTSNQDQSQDQDQDQDQKDDESGDKADLEGSVINLMASQNWIKDVDNELFDAFKEETGIEVKVSLTPDNEYESLLGTTFSGGSDAVDMFMYSAGSPMISAGIPDVAVDLSDEPWAGNLEDWAVTANTYGGKLVGFSTWGVDYEGILYNKTYFQENNLEVPKTWDEFMALCDQILELGTMPLYEGINGSWHTQTWVYGMTSSMLEEKPDLVDFLNSDKNNKYADIACFKEGLTQLSQLLSAKEGDAPKYFTNDGQAEDWFGSYTALQDREALTSTI